jgi:hypothetical protein
MLGLLKRTAASAQATKSMLLHNLESRGLSLEDTVDQSATSIQVLPLPTPPSIVLELSSMDIPRTAMDELCKTYDSSVHQIRTTMTEKYRTLAANLRVIPSAGAAPRDKLHKAISARYLKWVACVKEDALNAARGIADVRAKEASPFKEVRYDFFPLLRETDVL